MGPVLVNRTRLWRGGWRKGRKGRGRGRVLRRLWLVDLFVVAFPALALVCCCPAHSCASHPYSRIAVDVRMLPSPAIRFVCTLYLDLFAKGAKGWLSALDKLFWPSWPDWSAATITQLRFL